MTTSKHVTPPRVKPEPRTPSKPALPRWLEHGQIRDATLEEVLMFALCGGRNERSLHPIVSLAERVAADVSGIYMLLRPQIDDLDVADLFQGTAERSSALAAISRLVL